MQLRFDSVAHISPDPQTLARMAARYYFDPDFPSAFPIVLQHGLVF
jgi:hypothetical protein